MVYVLTVVAAAVVAGGEVVQQRMAARAPPDDNLSLALLWWLVRRPRWLAGVGCSLVGNLVFAAALGRGSVVLVEAVFVSRLLFGLVTAALWGRMRVPWRDLYGGLLIAAGLVAFLLAARPRESPTTNGPVPWVLATAVPVGFALLLTMVASRLVGSVRAALLGAGSGALFGLQAVLVQASVHLLGQDGFVTMLANWHPWATLTVAVLGMLLVQSAFSAAPLRSSYPAVVTAQLLCAIGLGVWALHGQLRHQGAALFALAPALAVMVVGITMLTRSHLVSGHHGHGG
ncbi:DMT family transporter [Nocardioides terrisoli]|uniref:DMT family transporter n=1 Tax=Nocardioides terrisoli TaxID=3388267 RepID=UPI00287B9F89|nr:DMT family transporter [Nocardioides marmorisolisilvae]